MALTTTYGMNPTKPEFTLNTNTLGLQTLPDAVGLSGGGFAVAYKTGAAVFVDFYDAAHNVIGTAQQPFTGTHNAAGEPSITQLADGNVLVVWDELDGAGSMNAGIFTQSGAIVAQDIQLNAVAGATQLDVTALANGNFIVSYDFGGNEFFRTFDANGAQIGSFTAINSTTAGIQSDCQIAALDDGGFVATWVDENTAPDALRARIFNGDGSVRTAELNIDTTGENRAPAVAGMKNGNWAVVYTDTGWGGAEGVSAGITLKIYDPNGANVTPGAFIHVNTPSTLEEVDPDVTVLDNGFIVVTWTKVINGIDHDTYARVFDQNGAAVTIDGSADEFAINTTVDIDSTASVAALLNGMFLTAWNEAGSDGSLNSIGGEVNELVRTTIGDAANDTFGGDTLRDLVSGGSGADTLLGGGGEDVLEGGFDGDLLDGGDGNDKLFAKTEADQDGSTVGDIMNGGAGDDIIRGANGDDTINGGGDDDFLEGGGGSDTINGDDGQDTIYGNDQDAPGGSLAGDTIDGGLGNDILHGSGGADAIHGGDQDDTILGHGGDDLLEGGFNSDTIDGGAGNDTIYALTQADPTSSGFGDSMTGGQGDDTIVGSGGEDWIYGGAGLDSVQGGDGNDVVVINNGDVVGGESYDGGGGFDTLHIGYGAAVPTSVNLTVASVSSFEAILFDNACNEPITLTINHTQFAGVTNVTGDPGQADTLKIVMDGASFIDLSTVTFAGWNSDAPENDRIIVNGTGVAENYIGTAYRDDIFAGGGGDVISGRAGADKLRGGDGDDIYGVDAAGEAIELANQGFDSVVATVSYNLGANLENLQLGGSANINGTGNGLVNTIQGNDGNNQLNGGGGADSLAGGLGNDRYIYGTGDTISELAGGGSDTVYSVGNYTLGANLEKLVITGASNSLGTGNELNNLIVGGDGGNTLDGKDGKDTLTGGVGADKFQFTTVLNAATNSDNITDFVVADDIVRIDNAVFTGLANGALAADAFHIGASAADAEDRIVYNAATGNLFFDADGTGGTAAVKFANLDTGLALTELDFFVI